MLLVYVIVTCALLLDYRFKDLKSTDTPDDKATLLDAIADEPTTVALIVFCFLCLLFVGALSCFHCYLVSSNQTTYEVSQYRRTCLRTTSFLSSCARLLQNFRYDYGAGANPYDRGCLGNCFEVWFRKIPPPHTNFRAYVDEVDFNRRPVSLTFNSRLMQFAFADGRLFPWCEMSFKGLL